MSKQTDSFLPTRTSLLGRIKEPASGTDTKQDKDRKRAWSRDWSEFIEIYGRVIYHVAQSAGLPDQEAQDVVQETFIAVRKSIHNFKPDPAQGSFKKWLFSIARRKVADQFRQRPPEYWRRHTAPEDDTRRTKTIDRIPDLAGNELEKSWEDEWRTSLIEAALDRVKQRVSIGQYQVYDLCVNKGMSARKVADTLEISITRVYLAKHRVGAQFKKAVREVVKIRNRDQGA